ncbi:MAG: class I SAM-dependent methyltransferase [Terriglobales bacterium]
MSATSKIHQQSARRSFDASDDSCATDACATELSRICRAYSRRTDQSRYSLSDKANLRACHEREKRVLAALVRHAYGDLNHSSILEVGCGTGFWLREFVRWGARPENIVGIDLLPDRISEAQVLCPASIRLLCANAERLQFSDGEFDVILQSTAFTSILDEGMKIQIAREMLRVLHPSGIILWYDFTVDNPWNPDVRGIPTREITRLFPGCRFEFERLTLAPPIGRRIARVSGFLYRALSAVRIFDTHCLATIRKTC